MALSRTDKTHTDQHIGRMIRGLDVPQHRPAFFAQLEEKLAAAEEADQAASPIATSHDGHAMEAGIGPNGRKHSLRVSRRFTVGACAAVVVLAALSAGVYVAAGHLGHGSILIIGDAESTAPPTAPSSSPSTNAATNTSASTSVGATTGTTAVRPSIDGPQLQRAMQVVNLYFSYLRAGKSAAFKKLLGPGVSMDANTLWGWERENLRKSSQAAYAVNSAESMVWGGGWYVPPTVRVPSDVDRWIRTDPSNRIGFKVTMGDGSFRYLQIEHQTEPDEWLLIPTDRMFAETSASVSDMEFATQQTKALAEQIAAAVEAEFPALAGAAISAHGVQDVPNMRPFHVQLVDDLATPHWVLTLVLQKNVTDISRVAPDKSSQVDLAGSTSGWVKDNLPFNAQVVILLDNGTMVNVGESALHTDEGEGPVPLDISDLKKVVELIAQQFGTVSY